MTKQVSSRINNKYYGRCIKHTNYIINIKSDQKSHNKHTAVKNIKDYKIFVFDLDYTLYLHVHNDYTNDYHIKVKNLLAYLKDNNKHLYIATHHSSPNDLIEELKITELMNCVIKETKDFNYCYSIEDYTSKKSMIVEILNRTENKDYTTDDVVFFDDNPYNINEVNECGVKSILVDGLKGVNLHEFY